MTASPAIQTDQFQPHASFEPEDKRQKDTEPLLSRASSYSNTNHQRRRRTDAKLPSPPPSLGRQRSLTGDISHAASETYLVTGLAFRLLGYLGLGYRWILRLLALGFYAMLLMPGFLQVAYHYFFSSQVRRSIVYGDQPRNRLDLYLPKNNDGPKPVLAFVTGGAWIIGNFPQGTISDMVKDVSQAISFVCDNIVEYGGDPNRIYLMGQSAGAHISACALMEQAISEFEGGSVSWSVTQIKAYFGLSGGYNIPNLVDHFHGRGLYRAIFLSLMEGEKSLQHFSPEIRIQDPSIRNAIALLPQFILIHGTADYSIPPDASKTFADALQRVGAEAELILYSGKTHTDLFLQDPMRGGKDELFDYIVAFIHAGDKEALAKDAIAPPRPRLLPEIILQLARRVSPF